MFDMVLTGGPPVQVESALMSTMERHLAQALAEVEALAEPPATSDEDRIAALERELLRTRALLAGALADGDDASSRLAGIQDRLAAVQDEAKASAAAVRGLRHRLTMAEADARRARGERDLARVENRAADGEPGVIAATAATTDLPTRLVADPPGPVLAQTLARVVGDLTVDPQAPAETDLGCLDGLTDDQVVTVVCAAQRLGTWAAAAQMQAAGHLRDRWAAPPMGGDDEALWITACEVALATGLTRHAAAAQLTAARHLPSRMPRVYRLFAGGRLATAKAMLIAEKTSDLPAETVIAIETVLLDPTTDLPEQITGPMTRGQLATLLDRLIAAARPDQADERAQDARARRGVTFGPLPDGMGSMTLVTSAEIIEAMRAALDELTLVARGRGRLDDPENHRAACDPDGRHPAAVRADVLADLVIGAAESHLQRVEPDTPDGPAQPAEPGPAAPGEAFHPPAPRTSACLSAVPGRHRRAEIVVLVPLSVLTGQAETPATLVGYGPIPAQLARELAADGIWRCAAVDDRTTPDGRPAPGHGTLLGLGRSSSTPSYSPGPGLKRFVEIRDGTCQFPGCRHPATRSDADHRIPWTAHPPHGQTCDCNLQTLCRHHHRLKHSGWISVRPLAGGGGSWTTRAGRTYLRRPDPV